MDVQGFKNAIETLKLYHRINKNDFSMGIKEGDDNYIDRLYVDLLPNHGIYSQITSNRTTFIVGRRGTGKSTTFAYAQNKIHEEKENLSVYINAKSVHELSKVENIGVDLSELSGVLNMSELRRLLLIRNFLQMFKKSLIDELQKESNGFFERFPMYYRDKKLQKELTKLDNIINNPELINISKAIQQDISNKETNESLAEIRAALQNLQAKISAKKIDSNEVSTSNVLARYFNLKDLVNSLVDILKICKRTKLYIFVDDFSELEKIDMISFVDVIISPLYHLGKEYLNIKIAAYPNRVYFGDLDTGKYDIVPIDLFDIYGKGNISGVEKSATNYTKRIIENRVNNYCDCSVDEFFDTKSLSLDEYYKILFYSSINVPRVLGHILYNCWLSHISQGKKINRNAIERASEKYYLDHTINYFDKSKHSKGVFDEKIDIYVQESLLKKLILRAQEFKYQLKELDNTYFSDLIAVPTSHFALEPELDNVLASLEFNGFIHKINELAAKGRTSGSFKNTTNHLYCFDYGLCVYEKILFGKPENKDAKYYQQRPFNYTSFLLEVLKENKQIVCMDCKSQYPIEKLPLFEQFKMKCMNCDDGKCQVQYDPKLLELVEKQTSAAIWTSDELDVLQAIYLLKNDNPGCNVTATMVASEIDRTHQFVSWRCRELANNEYVIRKGNSPYTYEVQHETVKTLERIGVIGRMVTAE